MANSCIGWPSAGKLSRGVGPGAPVACFEGETGTAIDRSDRRIMEPDVLDPSGALTELFNALLSNKDMDGILNDVLQLTQRHILGAEQCSITLIRGARANTVVTTGKLALDLDEVQYEQGWGPCLDAG